MRLCIKVLPKVQNKSTFPQSPKRERKRERDRDRDRDRETEREIKNRIEKGQVGFN